MKNILVVAKNTYRELIRERLLYGILLAAALVSGASFLAATVSLGQDTRVLQNTGLSAITILTLFICIFVTTTSVRKDFDQHALYFLFPKPVSPHQYILGKFLGMFLLMLSALVILGGLFALGVSFVAPTILPAAGITLGFACLEISLLIGLALLFACFTAPLNSVLYTLALYVIGHNQSFIKLYAAEAKNTILNRLVDFSYYFLPNLEKFDYRAATLYSVSIPGSAVAWALVYWLIYLGIILYLAGQVMHKHEF